MGHMVEDRHLRPTLARAIGANPLIERTTAAVTGHTPGPGGVHAQLGGGRRLTAADRASRVFLKLRGVTRSEGVLPPPIGSGSELWVS